MKRTTLLTLASVATGLLALGVVDVHAYRLIQNTNVGRTSIGTRVTCDDPLGFAHRTTSTVGWWLNPASQGGKPGTLTAFQNALAAWTAVSAAGYSLQYSGTTSAGFATDGLNTALWSSTSGCTGGCLAITALVLGPGQQILEADISFNDAMTWNTNGSDYDLQAIATHELGHSMGIHHTDLTQRRNRPTMYAAYIGTDGRTLEADDRSALTCVHDRYPPGFATTLAVGAAPAAAPSGPGSVRLVSRARRGASTLRFALDVPGRVRLDVFDVAGRKIATLLDDDVRDAGEHELAWSGTNSSGRARPGIYFARVVTSRGSGHTSILLEE